MRAVFDIIPGENLAHQRFSLPGLGVPACFDGGLAGHGMEHFVPHGVRLSAACLLLFAVLTQAAGTVIGQGQTAVWGVFGAMLLREDAGGDVLVAVVSFAAAAAITALCFRLRNRENRKKGGADNTEPQKQEGKTT